jgi:hypothetical protein
VIAGVVVLIFIIVFFVLTIIILAVVELDFFAIYANCLELGFRLGRVVIPVCLLEGLFYMLQSQIPRQFLDLLVL